jgi:hypothetical protein
MTAVLSGTNGLLQAYDYQTPTTGFSYTFTAGIQMLVMNPAGTLATGTITMPASPSDGMTITFSSSQQITALTLNGNTGQTVVGAVTFLPAKTGVSYVYRLASTSWFPTVTVPGTGSQLVQGTTVASTSGTSIDFTSIPSWVKRITVSLRGVSTSGSSDYLVQIGSGSITNTGYAMASVPVQGSASSGSATTSTIGFNLTAGSVNSASFMTGLIYLVSMGGNVWVENATLVDSGGNRAPLSSGSLALSGALDRVRVTTVNGTDTFDAGSINILYE